MGLKDNVDASINNMETITDAMFPPLPATRKTSSDVRNAFDGVYNEMRAIGDMMVIALQSEIDTLQTEIDTVNSQLSTNSGAILTMSSSLTSLIGTVAGHTTSIGNLQSNKVDKTIKVNGQPLSADVTISVPVITAGASVANVATNAATNAPTDAKTDYGLLAAILGADVNSTNSKQNATATNLNALATSYNASMVKLNSLIATLRTNGIIAP